MVNEIADHGHSETVAFETAWFAHPGSGHESMAALIDQPALLPPEALPYHERLVVFLVDCELNGYPETT
jgi:hypothetical protein